MSQPQRLLLIHVADRQVADIFHRIGIGILAALAQKRHQLRVRRKVVLNGLLLAAVDDHDLISAGSQTLFHHILDGRAISRLIFHIVLRSGRVNIHFDILRLHIHLLLCIRSRQRV